MGYLNRAWMAASVAAVQGHSDQGQKCRPGLVKSLQHGRRKLLSALENSDLRPLAAVAVGVGSGPAVKELQGAQRSDESIRNVMYLNCWGQC